LPLVLLAPPDLEPPVLLAPPDLEPPVLLAPPDLKPPVALAPPDLEPPVCAPPGDGSSPPVLGPVPPVVLPPCPVPPVVGRPPAPPVPPGRSSPAYDPLSAKPPVTGAMDGALLLPHDAATGRAMTAATEGSRSRMRSSKWLDSIESRPENEGGRGSGGTRACRSNRTCNMSVRAVHPTRHGDEVWSARTPRAKDDRSGEENGKAHQRQAHPGRRGPTSPDRSPRAAPFEPQNASRRGVRASNRPPCSLAVRRFRAANGSAGAGQRGAAFGALGRAGGQQSTRRRGAGRAAPRRALLVRRPS
jgi:hypothetical protein